MPPTFSLIILPLLFRHLPPLYATIYFHDAIYATADAAFAIYLPHCCALMMISEISSSRRLRHYFAYFSPLDTPLFAIFILLLSF